MSSERERDRDRRRCGKGGKGGQAKQVHLCFFTVYAVRVCVSECVWVCELTASSLDTKMLLMTASGASEWKAEGAGSIDN